MPREGLTVSVTRKASERPSKAGEWGQELGDPAARQGGSPGAVEAARTTPLSPSGLTEGPHVGVQRGTASDLGVWRAAHQPAGTLQVSTLSPCRVALG